MLSSCARLRTKWWWVRNLLLSFGPFLVNIFINDLFFSITKSEVCNFYICNKNLEHVFALNIILEMCWIGLKLIL